MQTYERRKPLRALVALILAAAMCLSLAPIASAESFSAYVKSDSMRVYADESLNFYLGSLKDHTVFTVLSYDDGVAYIRYKGNQGYAKVSDMGRVSDVATLAQITKNTKVYAKASSSSKATSVKKGLTVYVLMTSGSWAMIERDGNVAYIKKRYLKLSEVEAKPTVPEEQPATPEGGKVVYQTFQAKIVKDSTRVYKSASTSSKYLGALDTGALVTVEAYNDDWAYIELDGNRGYCARGALEKYAEDPHAYMSDGKLSNEKVIYQFLTEEMKLNTAAACGILANIKYESGYRESATGDAGRSHGICQWFAARWTRMTTFCTNRDLDPASLAGQLWFLQYELEKYYPMVYKYLTQSTANSASGAYDAGWYFCYHFEGPSNRESVSETRAEYARDTLWERYN